MMRMFLQLPFEHSENIEDQFESARLSRALVEEEPWMAEVLMHAEQHLETIQRFGRFPARNRVLKRQSTPEEINFLDDQSPNQP